MRDDLSFLLRSLLHPTLNEPLQNALNVNAADIIRDSDDMDEQTKDFLGAHLGLSVRSRSPVPSRPSSSSSSSSSSTSSTYSSSSSRSSPPFESLKSPTSSRQSRGNKISVSLTPSLIQSTFEKLTSWNFEMLQLQEESQSNTLMYLGFCVFRYFDFFDKYDTRLEGVLFSSFSFISILS
jgi:hypothetical protein